MCVNEFPLDILQREKGWKMILAFFFFKICTLTLFLSICRIQKCHSVPADISFMIGFIRRTESLVESHLWSKFIQLANWAKSVTLNLKISVCIMYYILKNNSSKGINLPLISTVLPSNSCFCHVGLSLL